MNIGLRYENTPPYHDKYRGIMNVQMFDPGVGSNGLLPNTKTPIFTRPGTGDFYDGLNFRFNDGPVHLLENTVKMGKAVRMRGLEGASMVAPPLVAKDFNFTSISDAV